MGTLKFLSGVLMMSAGAACCKPADSSVAAKPSPAASESPVPLQFPEIRVTAIVERPGEVVLSWNVSDMMSAFYKMDRRKAGGGWQTLAANLKPATELMKYMDQAVEPKTEYQYQVSLGSTDPEWLKMNPSGLTGRASAPLSVRTPGMWHFEFSNMLSYPDEDPPRLGQAYVTIKKWDQDHGLVEWRKIHHEGDLLGVIRENGAEDSTHRVATRDGKMATVDFKSGARLKKIVIDKLMAYTYLQCRLALDHKGVPKCAGPDKVWAQYKANEVTFTDEEGRDRMFSVPAGPEAIKDSLCVDHGGPSPTALRQAEALRLSESADLQWPSESRSLRLLAQQKYRTLLEFYGDVGSVKARRAELSERALKKLE